MCRLYCHSPASHCVPRDGQSVCSPKGVVKVGAICSTAFSAAFFWRNHFAAAGSQLVAPSPSLWSSKALWPLDLVKKINPEFQCRVPGGKERASSKTTKQSAFCSQLCDNVLTLSGSVTSPRVLPSYPYLALGPGDPLCVSRSLSRSAQWEQGAGYAPVGVYQTAVVVLLQNRLLQELGGG